MPIVPIVSGSQLPWPLGTIVASARTMPAAANLAREQAHEARSRRQKPWLELAPPPPDVTFTDLAFLHRSQIHTAVARRIGGRKGGNFAASLTVDLGLDLNRQQAIPHLIVATTRFRGPYKFCDRIDLVAVPCTESVAAYYATPAPLEIAQWAFNRYAPLATYRVVINKFGLVEAFKKWGSDEEWEFGR